MKSINFEILRENLPELSDAGAFSEQYLYSDPQSSVLKLRYFIEILIPYLYRHLNIAYESSWTLYDFLKNDIFTNTIDKLILGKFHAIRMTANTAIHKGVISSKDSIFLLKEAYDIARWLKITIYAQDDFYQEFLLPEDNNSKIINSEPQVEPPTLEDFHPRDTINSCNLDIFKVHNTKTTELLNLNNDAIQAHITLKDFFMDYNLTSDQKKLLVILEKFLVSKETNVFLLKGYAGTGKTFIIKGLTEYLTLIGRESILAAPTGKAAKVIREKTNNEAYTIHKTIYSYKDLKEYKVENIDGSETFKFYFALNENIHKANTIYIIDEASMVGDTSQEGEFFRFGSGKLLSDLMEHLNLDHNDHNKKIIFIGDSAQLPPIGMNVSPALDEKYLNEKFNVSIQSFELTEIVRQQKDSGIVENSLSLRESIRKNIFYKLDFNLAFDDVKHIEHEDILSQYLESCNYKINGDSIIIAHANSVVDEYNSLIRKHFFPNSNFICAGDKIMAIANNGIMPIFIYNGDFGLVRKVDSSIIKREVYVREKINDTLITTILPLWFRRIEIGFKSLEDTKTYFFECLIFENILYRDTVYKDTSFKNNIDKYGLDSRDINRLETVALYVDFVNRAKEKGLKPNTDAFKQAIKKDEYFNCLKIKFGYALTCHKAQGSEWENVFVNCKTHESVLSKNYFRWLYTAITRSSKKLYVIDEPHTPISESPIGPEESNGQIKAGENIVQFIEKKVQEVSTKYNVVVQDIKHHKYCELYSFKNDEQNFRIQIFYDKKNKITSIQSVEHTVLVDFFNELVNEIENTIVFTSSGEEPIFEFPEIFLEEFYFDLNKKTSSKNIKIIDIKHISYCERYTFQKGTEIAIINFWYKGNQQFKLAPQPQNNSSIELVKEVFEALR